MVDIGMESELKIGWPYRLLPYKKHDFVIGSSVHNLLSGTQGGESVFEETQMEYDGYIVVVKGVNRHLHAVARNAYLSCASVPVCPYQTCAGVLYVFSERHMAMARHQRR